MPPRSLRKTAAQPTQRVARPSKRSALGVNSTPTKSTDEDEESDDPLAIPLDLVPRTQHISRTQRKAQSDSRTKNVSKTSRLQRSVDRVVGGVEMAEGDLIPPSDEDEFDAWAAMRTNERRATERGSSVSTRSVGSQGNLGTEPPSSPTEMIRKKSHVLRTVSPARSALDEVPMDPPLSQHGYTVGGGFCLFPDEFLDTLAGGDDVDQSDLVSSASELAKDRYMSPEMAISDKGPSIVPEIDEFRKTAGSQRQGSADTRRSDGERSLATPSFRSSSPDLTPPPSPSLPPGKIRANNPNGICDLAVNAEMVVTNQEDQDYASKADAEKQTAAVPSHNHQAADRPMDHTAALEHHSPRPLLADIEPHLSTPKNTNPVGEVTVAQSHLHSTPQSARSIGIERVPFYSLTTPKRRCMEANFISPLRPRSMSQPVSPQQPMPSFGESQYNQLGATMKLDPPSQHTSEVDQVQTPRELRAASSESPQNIPCGTSYPLARVESELDDLSPQRANLLASGTSTPHKPPEPPPVPAAPVDPALQQFRSARTFRTRTALQLQPYTRERAVYEAVLRRGGLKKGKHAIALPKDISSDEDDEEEAPESSQSASPPAETIVIGGTPLPPRKHREYRRLEVTDLDKSEYFLRRGVLPGSEEEVDASLQRIARKRVRAEKEERRRQREERRREKEFASLLRGRSIPQDLPTDEQANRRSRLTDGKRKMYSRKSITSRPAPQGGDGSQPLVTPVSSPLHYDISDMPAPSPSLAQLSPPGYSPAPSATRLVSLSPLAGTRMGDSIAPFSPPSDIRVRHPDTSGMLESQAEDDSAASESDSDSSIPDVSDRRAKIARRMLPAAMLKRLEQEAAVKERKRKDRQSAKESRMETVVAPGKAVRRRGNGEVDLHMFEDEASSDDSLAAASGAAQSIPNVHEVADDSEMDSDSQAEEDNRGGETLARLYNGDFESIVRGGPPRHGVLEIARRRHHRSRPKRPIVPLKRRQNGRSRGMVQTRIDFPSYGKVSATHPASRSAGPGRSVAIRTRPAIRLDERTIFSVQDFDLEDKEDTPVKKSKAPPKSATFASKEATLQVRLDTEVGKAKSWANLEKFSVDFDISPLPSGLECSGFPISRLADLVDMLDSPTTGGRSVDSVEHLGVDFDIDFDDAAMQDAVGRYLSVLQDRLLSGDDSFLLEASDVVTFLSCALLNPNASTQDEPGFVAVLDERLSQLQEKLDTMGQTMGTVDRDRRMRLAGALWFILELRIVMSRRWRAQSRADAVDSVAIALFRLLLSVGFDKAIRPLKICLRGESINGRMTDVLTCMWIAATHALETHDRHCPFTSDTLNRVILQAVTEAFHFDLVGPVAAERLWYITFGLCAISQFNDRGRTTGGYEPVPRWGLVRKALSLIKIAHEEEAEEKVHVDLLRGRDRYVRVMMARCVRLSAVWKWGFTRETFPIITKDLGTTFKQRQYRNFPTEPPVDYPDWITSFEIAATAMQETKHETAFEMYLRLICVAASDIIDASQSLAQAQQAEKDIRRLIMSIIPVSPVKFSREFPPTQRQLAQLVNRYSTMVAACYFSPSILSWLLANSRKWTNFETADFGSRQISIRGLMYVAVACRHHKHSLRPIIARLSEILQILQVELDTVSGPSIPMNRGRDAIETRRTMVLVISCFKQVILRHSFDSEIQAAAIYPDPSLLDPSWTSRIFDLSSHDFRSGLEVVSAVQAYLDTRLQALPPSVKKAREERVESQDEFGSLGFELDPVTVAQLGGYEKTVDEAEIKEAELATIIAEAISPRIYRLLSDILSANTSESDAVTRSDPHRVELLQRLTTCWADCAAILVVDHRRLDWSTFVGPFGQQSWSRLNDDAGRIQVGLPFMLNILQIDTSAFKKQSDEFISLFFSIIGTDRITVEHKLLALLMSNLAFLDHPLFTDIERVWQPSESEREMTQETYFQIRPALLDTIFVNIAQAFSITTGSLRKPFLYRCINDLVSSLERYMKDIPDDKVIHKQSYRVHTTDLVRSLRGKLGNHISPLIVPALKAFPSS